MPPPRTASGRSCNAERPAGPGIWEGVDHAAANAFQRRESQRASRTCRSVRTPLNRSITRRTQHRIDAQGTRESGCRERRLSVNRLWFMVRVQFQSHRNRRLATTAGSAKPRARMCGAAKHFSLPQSTRTVVASVAKQPRTFADDSPFSDAHRHAALSHATTRACDTAPRQRPGSPPAFGRREDG